MDNQKNHSPINKPNKLSIEIKRKKDDTFDIIVTRDEERHHYPIDAPELEPYRDSITFQMALMKSTNAGSVTMSAQR